MITDDDGNTFITIRVGCRRDRHAITQLINCVAAEQQYLQTDRYCSTPLWEQALQEGMNRCAGVLLLVVVAKQEIIGFGRLTPDDTNGVDRTVGNIGIALLPPYRSRGIGSQVLTTLLLAAPDLAFRRMTAAILETNIRSRNLFCKFGFQLIAQHQIRLPFLRQDLVDELLYELEVSSKEAPCCIQHRLHLSIAINNAR